MCLSLPQGRTAAMGNGQRGHTVFLPCSTATPSCNVLPLQELRLRKLYYHASHRGTGVYAHW